MKVITRTFYICEICGAEHSSKEDAKKCESIPIKYDKGVKVGDKVRVTSGQGAGEIGIVEEIWPAKRGWGPTPSYDHAVTLSAKMIESYGHRVLSFDSYEPVND